MTPSAMGAPCEIRPVPLRDKAARLAFLRMSWPIYAGDPCWVPPTLTRQAALLDPARGPFYESGEVAAFLAWRDGLPVGRVCAHVDHRYEQYHDARTGFFGFFECIDDAAVAAALFEAAAAWLRVRGKTRILGPMSFSIYDEIGILVDGFETPPPILLTHNPPYYEALVLAWGFRKAIDWYAVRITERQVDAAIMQAQVRRIMGGSALRLAAPTPRDVVRRAPELRDLFNEEWAGNWGHIPFSARQFTGILADLRPILRPDLMRIVLDGPKLVAFIITIPDLNPFLKTLDGRLSLWNQWQLYREAHYRPLRHVKTVLLGVHRAYQRRGLHHAMILDTYGHLLRTQPHVVSDDCSLICETNRALLRPLQRYGAQRYKTYRLYEREV